MTNNFSAFNIFNKSNYKLESSAIIHSDFMVLGKNALKYRNKIRKSIFKETNLENIFIPTFSYYGKKINFDLTDKAIKMGVFANECIEHLHEDTIQRSPNPIHSYVHLSRYPTKTKFEKNFKNNVSFGSKSVFKYFEEFDPLWCCLGCDITDGFTVFHHAETIAQVPYRKWITLKKNILVNGKDKLINYQYFDKIVPMKFDFNNAVINLIKSNIVSKFKYGNSIAYIGKYKIILHEILNKLENDPFYLAKPANKDMVFK